MERLRFPFVGVKCRNLPGGAHVHAAAHVHPAAHEHGLCRPLWRRKCERAVLWVSGRVTCRWKLRGLGLICRSHRVPHLWCSLQALRSATPRTRLRRMPCRVRARCRPCQSRATPRAPWRKAAQLHATSTHCARSPPPPRVSAPVCALRGAPGSALDHSQGKWFAPGEALPPGFMVTAHPEGHTAPAETHAMSDKAKPFCQGLACLVLPWRSAEGSRADSILLICSRPVRASSSPAPLP